MPVQRPAAERAIFDFLAALGHDPNSSQLSDTPRRVVEAFADELLVGYDVDIRALLDNGSEPTAGEPGIVVVRDISLATVCPHHLMPATGTATVAYAPGRRILGLGTVAHLVTAFARRLSLQEKIGTDVVETLVEYGARGAYCQLALRHSCLSARGAEQSQASVVTTASAGAFRGDSGMRELSLALTAEPAAP